MMKKNYICEKRIELFASGIIHHMISIMNFIFVIGILFSLALARQELVFCPV